MMISVGASGGHKLNLTNDVVADILSATHAMLSWTASEEEGEKGGVRWNGMAEENVRKYMSMVLKTV
jgi:hypothetical protein